MAKQNERQLVGTLSWDWYCTLTVFGLASADRGERLFSRWIRELERAEGGPRFRWIRTLETDRSYGHTTLHVLVGGLRKRERYWRRQWQWYGGGECVIEPHDRQGGKLVKAVEQEDNEVGPNIKFKLPGDGS
jgi:hypothetical protein